MAQFKVQLVRMGEGADAFTKARVTGTVTLNCFVDRATGKVQCPRTGKFSLVEEQALIDALPAEDGTFTVAEPQVSKGGA